MLRLFPLALLLASAPVAVAEPAHGPLRVAKSGTHLEHADGTPFFFLADTCWTGPALGTEAEWDDYLQDRKKKGFTAIQFNMVSPWRTAPTDAEGRVAYTVADGKLVPNVAFYRDRLDQRMRAVTKAGLLPVPVLVWAHKKGDAGKELNEEQLTALIDFELKRYADVEALWILAGDNTYTTDAEMWKRIGRKVFADNPRPLVTTHPTGENFPWKSWESEKWLTVLGYQSGHGDSAKSSNWIIKGPVAEYGKRSEFTRPVLNLEPPYEGHNGYSTKKPHSDFSTRRATYWSLLNAPVAGVTYGGHGVWSWHTKPGKGPTDHEGTGVAKVWREALDLPGAAQMGHARKFFESIPEWPQLRPAPELLKEQPGDADPTKFIAAAATADRKVVVAYIPAGNATPLKWAFVSDPIRAKVEWINPRTGERMPGQGAAAPTPPDASDWLLVVR